MTIYRNITDALIGNLQLLAKAPVVPSHNGSTRELRAHVTRIAHPQEREFFGWYLDDATGAVGRSK